MEREDELKDEREKIAEQENHIEELQFQVMEREDELKDEREKIAGLENHIEELQIQVMELNYELKNLAQLEKYNQELQRQIIELNYEPGKAITAKRRLGVRKAHLVCPRTVPYKHHKVHERRICKIE